MAKKHFKYIVLEEMKAGRKPKDIAELYNRSEPNIAYYTGLLKDEGKIKMIGYGTWEIVDEPKQLKKSTAPTTCQLPDELAIKDKRGHAFEFKLKIPKIRHWQDHHDRTKVLERMVEKKIIDKFSFIRSNKCHQIFVKNPYTLKFHRVWLSRISIIVFWPEGESIFASNAVDVQEQSVIEFLSIIESLEKILKIPGQGFKINKKYQFTVCAIHLSQVRSALAKFHLNEGSKLRIYNSSGPWLLVDNSHHFEEDETISPVSAVDDRKTVTKFYNNLRDHPTTFGEAYSLISANAEAIANNESRQEFYSKNLESHTKAIQSLDEGIEFFVDREKKKVIKSGIPTDLDKEIKRIFRDVRI